MRRTTIAAWATESTSAESWPWAASRSGADSGQGWVCTEPPRHHDQTSSVANTITGANRRSSTSSAIASAARAEAAPVSPAGALPWARSLTSSM